MAGNPTPRLPRLPARGLDDLHSFATLQRQVAEREVPLRTRQRRRRRAKNRRLAVRLALVLLPLVLVLVVAVNAGGSRDWLRDQWQDVTTAATTSQSAPAYSAVAAVRAS